MLEKYLYRSFQDSIPHKINRKRIYIFPTKVGLIFVLTVFAMLITSINTGSNLGYLMTFFMASIFVVSIFHTYKNLDGISITALNANATYAGQAATFEISLKAAKLIHPIIKVNLKNSDQEKITIRANEFSALKISKKTTRRGVYKPEYIMLSTSYPFGIISAWTYFRPEIEVLVYPKPLKTFQAYHIYTESNRLDGGEISTEGNDDFNYLREYVPGDPLSSVSWKSLAKGQGMHTKEFEGEAGRCLLLDYNQVIGDDPEYKLSYLCSLVLEASKKQQVYTLSLPSAKIDIGSGYAQQVACLEALALHEVGHAG